jgi:hypothetical protein
MNLTNAENNRVHRTTSVSGLSPTSESQS